jgi:hypothetical protein
MDCPIQMKVRDQTPQGTMAHMHFTPSAFSNCGNGTILCSLSPVEFFLLLPPTTNTCLYIDVSKHTNMSTLQDLPTRQLLLRSSSCLTDLID